MACQCTQLGGIHPCTIHCTDLAGTDADSLDRDRMDGERSMASGYTLDDVNIFINIEKSSQLLHISSLSLNPSNPHYWSSIVLA